MNLYFLCGCPHPSLSEAQTSSSGHLIYLALNEERGADTMRSCQLLPPPQKQPVTPNPEERCRHADPTTKPQRLSNGDQ